MAVNIKLKTCCFECENSRLATIDRGFRDDYGQLHCDRLVICDNEPICEKIANDSSEYLNA